MPLGASGSSTISAKLFAASGASVHFSGGIKFSPSRLCFFRNAGAVLEGRTYQSHAHFALLTPGPRRSRLSRPSLSERAASHPVFGDRFRSARLKHRRPL